MFFAFCRFVSSLREYTTPRKTKSAISNEYDTTDENYAIVKQEFKGNFIS